MRDSLAKVNDAVKGFISDEICTAEAFTRALRITLHWLKCDKVAKKIQVIFDGSHWKSTNGNDVSDVNKTDVLDSPVWLYYFLLLLLGAQHQCSIHLSHEGGPVASLLSMDDLKAVMGLLSDVVEKTFRVSLSSLKWMYVKSTISTKLPRSRIDDLLQHRRVDGLLDLLVKDIPREIRLRTELLSEDDQKDNTNVVNEVRTIVVTETLLQKSDNSSAYTFGEAGNVKAGESVLFQILVGILEPELRKLLMLTSKECLEATAPTAAGAGKEEENPADEGTEVIEKNMNQEQKQSLSLLHTVAKALEELEVGGDVPQALFEACNFCRVFRNVPLTNVGYICFTAAVDAALQTILSDLLEWCLEDPSVKSELSQLSKSLFGQLMAREPFYYLLTSASIPILKESKPKLCSRVQQQLISDYPSVSTYFIYPALNAIHKYLVDAETTGKEGARPKRGGAKDGPPPVCELRHRNDLYAAIRIFSLSNPESYNDLSNYYVTMLKERLLYRVPNKGGVSAADLDHRKQTYEKVAYNYLKACCEDLDITAMVNLVNSFAVNRSIAGNSQLQLETRLLHYKTWGLGDGKDPGATLLQANHSASADAPLPVPKEVADLLTTAQTRYCQENADYKLLWQNDNTCRCIFIASYPKHQVKVHCTFAACQLFTAIALKHSEGVLKSELLARRNRSVDGSEKETRVIDSLLKPFVKNELLLDDGERVRINLAFTPKAAQAGIPEYILWPICKPELTVPDAEEAAQILKNRVDNAKVVIVKILKSQRRLLFKDLIREIMDSRMVSSKRVAKEAFEKLIELDYVERETDSDYVQYKA
ncbi:hypothetical protein AGDE_16978 [Angomonas deanei]|nr:hypothetical protein AGDE_16978 [Angomonas deanei]|eukprot:EPY15763.1 hypothetical protein AGDE_16978 [Angomonas deanei]